MEARQMKKIAGIERQLKEAAKIQTDTTNTPLPQGDINKREEELQELALELK
jgi:hypothetical protein